MTFVSRTAELLLGEWEGLISSLVKLDKSSNLAKHNKLDESRSPLHEQTNTLSKENPGKENSEPAQLYRSQQAVVEGEEDVQRGGKKTNHEGGEKWQQASTSEAREDQKGEELRYDPNLSSSSQQTVACSICSVAIAPTHLEKHEERCAGLQKSFTAPPPLKPMSSRPQLPKLVYALLKETELRKKCKEAGLNWKGDKNTLIKRHRRFSLLYNVEREEERPRPNAVLAAQVASCIDVFILINLLLAGGQGGAGGVVSEAGDSLPPPVRQEDRCQGGGGKEEKLPAAEQLNLFSVGGRGKSKERLQKVRRSRFGERRQRRRSKFKEC